MREGAFVLASLLAPCDIALHSTNRRLSGGHQTPAGTYLTRAVLKRVGRQSGDGVRLAPLRKPPGRIDTRPKLSIGAAAIARRLLTIRRTPPSLKRGGLPTDACGRRYRKCRAPDSRSTPDLRWRMPDGSHLVALRNGESGGRPAPRSMTGECWSIVAVCSLRPTC